MSRKPLADHAAFRTWPKQPREWGPDGSGWRSWFGGGVVDGLCDVLDEHLATRPGRDMSIAAIGCVPWLTSAAVVDRLAALGSCCVVIDKSENAPPPVLRKLSGSGFPNAAITRLEDVMPAVDGAAPLVIGPYTPREATWHEIEAVRVVGWRAGKYKPLPHAKVLVLGQVGWVTYETPYGDQEEFRFIPSKVWWGQQTGQNSRACIWRRGSSVTISNLLRALQISLRT